MQKTSWIYVGPHIFIGLCLCVGAIAARFRRGWYTVAQAVNGAKVYQKTCAGCHGAKLQGGMGPALFGKELWLTYGGKKASTLWSAVHTQMPMMLPGSVGEDLN